MDGYFKVREYHIDVQPIQENKNDKKEDLIYLEFEGVSDHFYSVIFEVMFVPNYISI